MKEAVGGCCCGGGTAQPEVGATEQEEEELARGPSAETMPGLKVFYATTKGTSKGYAEELEEAVSDRGIPVSVAKLQDYDPEKLQDETDICVFIVPTYEGGTPPQEAAWFHKWLDEARNDFRIDSRLLSSVRYAVFGLGDSVYQDNYNVIGSQIDMWMAELAAVRVHDFTCGDENTAKSLHAGQRQDFLAWVEEFLPVVGEVRENPGKFVAVAAPNKVWETDSEDDDDGENGDGADGGGGSGAELVDLEDMGKVVKKMAVSKKQRKREEAGGPKREMVTPELRKELGKQGYKIIGSHSGVKLCRWTKSMLRGRGGCYKHTFYGIESHQCMETTPSLACANKCVFCWRHHSNPVGTSWRWKMDDPLLIIDGAMQNHYDMIKQFKGVPGVIPARFKEANQIKHCALSLVGEPIMYPEINKFLEILHSRRISSFLVTNAQFPESMRSLTPVCQLYVSIDASTKESLRKIDRPLFKDFWPRFIDSLKELKEKGQRTVYRLTIVKAWNDDEVQNYAKLLELGQPDFIEVKGVTFCGDSKASTLTMNNVPWHEEVINFVNELVSLAPGYRICSEHEHSNSLLIAHERFLIGGRWHTWIDYDRFHELVGEGEPFTAMDYYAPTPDWAIHGAPERGFDPIEVRHHRKKPAKNVHGC